MRGSNKSGGFVDGVLRIEGILLHLWVAWDRGLEMAKHKTFTVATDASRSTSAIRKAPGEERTCPPTRKRNSIELRYA